MLVFVGIPLAIIAVIALRVYGRSLVHQPNRYRPGKPWTYPPSWYLPHPDAVVSERRPTGHAARSKPAVSTTAVGGASGEW